MAFSVLADAGDEGNAILAIIASSMSTPVQPPLPPSTPTHGYFTSAQCHRQCQLRIQELAKGLIHPSMREYIQCEFKITDQDVAALDASGSHQSGPPGGGTPRRGPPRGSRGPPGGGRGPPGGNGGGAGGVGDPPPPGPPPPSPPLPSPPGSSSSGGSHHRRHGGRRMNQDELCRQMDLLAEDACQRSEGHNIEKVTHTNMVMTVYEDGGPPMSALTLSRISNP